MDDNDYSSRDELDLETGGRAAMEVSDSSDDEAAPLPAFSRSRTGRNLAPGPAASGAFHRPSAPEVHPSGGPIDEWRQTVEGFDGGPEADDELEGAETIDLDSSDGEGQQDVDDPATLAEQEQDEMAELRIPVQSLASALGGYEDVAMDDGTTMETYVPGDDCLGMLATNSAWHELHRGTLADPRAFRICTVIDQGVCVTCASFGVVTMKTLRARWHEFMQKSI